MSKVAAIVRYLGIILLGVTVLVAPWCFGSIHASVQRWLFPGIMLSLICGMVTLLFDGKNRFSFSILLVPVLLMLLLIGQQFRTYDHTTLSLRSPKVAELREQLLPAPDTAEYVFTKAIFPETHSSVDPASTSIYPAATRHQFLLFVMVVSVFFASLLLFKDRLSVFIFSAIAAANGAILALLGIVIRLSLKNSTFLFWNNTAGEFSTFLNRNNAAGYLGMCLGLGVILLLWYFFKSDRVIEESRRWDHKYELAYMTSRQILAHRFSRLLTPGILSWGLVIGIVIAGIFISMSRGGCLAMLMSLVVGGLIVFATRRFKASMIGFISVGILGIGLVFWAGMDEKVQKRIETLFTGDNTARPRNWTNAIDTARDFQWRGAGFGTYQYSNLLNDEFAAENLVFVRAENQYIEIFLDLGPWGLLLLLTCLLVTLGLCWRLIWQRNNDWLTALGGGLFIAIMSQAIASLFDFGLYIAANAMLLGVLCGILSGVAIPRTEENDEISETPNRPFFPWWEFLQRAGLLVTGCLFLVLLSYGRKEIENIYHVNLATKRMDRIEDFRVADLNELNETAVQLETALQRRPDDALTAQKLAELQIILYRRAVYRNMLITSDMPQSPENIWGRTSLKTAHASIGRLRRLGFTVPAQAISEHPAVDEYLRPAFANLVRARQANQMLSGVHFRIAELVPLLDKEHTQQQFEQEAIARITMVTPLSATAWYEAGALERNMGNITDARAFWKQSLSLSRLCLKDIVELTKDDLRSDNAETVFRDTFPNSPELLLFLTSRQFSKKASPDYYDIALEQLKISCETASDLTEDLRHYHLGHYFLLKGEYESGINELVAACAVQHTNHLWRYQLARAYLLNRQYPEATEQINKALFYDPTNKGYMALRNDIKKAEFTRRK